jgi:uncharacterized protein YacL
MIAWLTLALSSMSVALQLAVLRRLYLRAPRAVMQSAQTPASQARSYVLDTSAVLDGRLPMLLQAGLLSPLLTADSVLRELQLLADKGDADKRLKGQQGLRLVAQLEDEYALRVVQSPTNSKLVDEQLLKLCLDGDYVLVTADHALALRAKTMQMTVCDIAQLSGALRTPYAPGDRLTLQLDKAGEQAGQAVGYLADGTMVVVRDAEARIGQSTEVVVQKTVQKDSGRILFAELSI